MKSAAMCLSLGRHFRAGTPALWLAMLMLIFVAPNDGWTATRLGPVALTVSHLETAEKFYGDVLGFTTMAGSEREEVGPAVESHLGLFGAHTRRVLLRLGEEQIELVEFLTPDGAPFPAGVHSNDRIFQHLAIVVGDMAAAYAQLRLHQVRYASSAPQKLPETNAAAAGIEAFYFRDPDGHFLEVIHFPPGKGDPRWQHPAPGKLFLGIDHTAIVVADTSRSLTFYRDVLGLNISGRSENFGDEQAHLNNVPGAHLRITSLRGANGVGVEFLEYLAPTDGRSLPSDAQVSDLPTWRIRAIVDDPESASRNLIAAGGKLLSKISAGDDGSFLVRDPDGHVLEVSR